MYKAGAAKKMDGLAFHPYAHNASGTMDKLKKVRKFMNKHGDKGAKIWVTEIGWATAGPKSEFRLGEGQTATQIKKVVPALWKARKGLKVGGFQYYTWSDKTACSTCIANHWGYYAGLIKLDGTHKKTFAAFKKAVRGLH
jgi:exo-beta-1,3-glucanase (GH17 family)